MTIKRQTKDRNTYTISQRAKTKRKQMEEINGMSASEVMEFLIMKRRNLKLI